MPKITSTLTPIFSAPPHSILLHACNTKGSWGAGVALAFKSHFPAAYKVYRAHCLPSTLRSNCALRTHQQGLVGTTLLIPPQLGDEREKKHWIACLFTSHGYGRAVATPDAILQATRAAMTDLERQIAEIQRRGGGEGEEVLGGCWAVRINSGKFGVEWGRSRRVLEEGGVDVVVVRREGEGDEDEGEDGGEKDAAVGGQKRGSGKGSGEEVWVKRKRGEGGEEDEVAKREGKQKKGGYRGATIERWLK